MSPGSQCPVEPPPHAPSLPQTLQLSPYLGVQILHGQAQAVQLLVDEVHYGLPREEQRPQVPSSGLRPSRLGSQKGPRTAPGAQQLQSEDPIPFPLPHSHPQTQGGWAVGGRVAGGTLGTLTSLTSFTAFTFSGASLNNSSKTSSADRSIKHLITMLLSLGQTGTFFHQSFSE